MSDYNFMRLKLQRISEKKSCSYYTAHLLAAKILNFGLQRFLHSHPSCSQKIFTFSKNLLSMFFLELKEALSFSYITAKFSNEINSRKQYIKFGLKKLIVRCNMFTQSNMSNTPNKSSINS